MNTTASLNHESQATIPHGWFISAVTRTADVMVLSQAESVASEHVCNCRLCQRVLVELMGDDVPCPLVTRLAPAFVDETLSPVLAAKIAEHLDRCSLCESAVMTRRQNRALDRLKGSDRVSGELAKTLFDELLLGNVALQEPLRRWMSTGVDQIGVRDAARSSVNLVDPEVRLVVERAVRLPAVIDEGVLRRAAASVLEPWAETLELWHIAIPSPETSEDEAREFVHEPTFVVSFSQSGSVVTKAALPPGWHVVASQRLVHPARMIAANINLERWEIPIPVVDAPGSPVTVYQEREGPVVLHLEARSHMDLSAAFCLGFPRELANMEQFAIKIGMVPWLIELAGNPRSARAFGVDEEVRERDLVIAEPGHRLSSREQNELVDLLVDLVPEWIVKESEQSNE